MIITYTLIVCYRHIDRIRNVRIYPHTDKKSTPGPMVGLGDRVYFFFFTIVISLVLYVSNPLSGFLIGSLLHRLIAIQRRPAVLQRVVGITRPLITVIGSARCQLLVFVVPVVLAPLAVDWREIQHHVYISAIRDQDALFCEKT